jgi:hypothetical protein
MDECMKKVDETLQWEPSDWECAARHRKEGFTDDVQTKTELANSAFDYGNTSFEGWLVHVCPLAHIVHNST